MRIKDIQAVFGPGRAAVPAGGFGAVPAGHRAAPSGVRMGFARPGPAWQLEPRLPDRMLLADIRPRPVANPQPWLQRGASALVLSLIVALWAGGIGNRTAVPAAVPEQGASAAPAGSAGPAPHYFAASGSLSTEGASRTAGNTGPATVPFGSTVADWRAFPLPTKLALAEGWVRTAFPGRVADLGDSGLRLAALDLVTCVDTATAATRDGVSDPVTEIGAVCIIRLWG